MGFNIAKLMQQAKAMQAKMEAEQAANAQKRFTGKAGANDVVIVVNGKGETESVSLSKTITEGMSDDDREILEDLIVAAFNDGNNQSKAEAAKSMEGLGAGMDLGALKNLVK